MCRELASRHVTVVLSGDGGDELFGGYDHYFPHPRVAAFDRWAPPGAKAVASMIWPLLPHGVTGKNFLRRVSRDARGRFLDEIGYFQRDEKDALLTGRRPATAGSDGCRSAAPYHFGRFGHLPWAAQMMRFDFETYLPEDILTKVDRMSMAHSIESRVPLLDNEVVDFSARLPADLKVRNGRRKHILKEAAAKWLPQEVLTRRKQGFAVPVGFLVPEQSSRLLLGRPAARRARASEATSSRDSSNEYSPNMSPDDAITRFVCGRW